MNKDKVHDKVWIKIKINDSVHKDKINVNKWKMNDIQKCNLF